MIDKLHRITVSWAGDKQTGFSHYGINFNASKDAMNILRGIFTFMLQGSSLMNCRLFGFLAERLQNIPDQISGLNLLHPDSLKRYMKRDGIQRFKVGFLKGELGDSARYPISSNTERWVTIFSSKARSQCGGSHLLKKALLDKRLFFYMLYKIVFQRLRYRGSHPLPLKRQVTLN